MFDKLLKAIDKGKEVLKALDISVTPPAEDDKSWKLSVAGTQARIGVNDGHISEIHLDKISDLTPTMKKISKITAENHAVSSHVPSISKDLDYQAGIAFWGDDSLTGGVCIAIVIADVRDIPNRFKDVNASMMDDAELFKVVKDLLDVKDKNLVKVLTSTTKDDDSSDVNISLIQSASVNGIDQVSVFNVFPNFINNMDLGKDDDYVMELLYSAVALVTIDKPINVYITKPASKESDTDETYLEDAISDNEWLEVVKGVDWVRHTDHKGMNPIIVRLAECIAKAGFLSQFPVISESCKSNLSIEPMDAGTSRTRKWFRDFEDTHEYDDVQKAVKIAISDN